MKKILLIASLFISTNVWSDVQEPKVCEVNVTKNSIEGLEMCNKGDNLLMFFSRSGRTKRPYRNRVIASNCEVNTITILETETVAGTHASYVLLCQFNGKSLEIVKQEN